MAKRDKHFQIISNKQSSNKQYFLYILYSGASLFLNWEKTKSEEVDKREERERRREKIDCIQRHSECCLCMLLPTAGGYLPRDLRGWDTICCSTLAGNSSAAAEELEPIWGWVCRRSLQGSENVVPNILVVPQIALKFNEDICWRWGCFDREDIKEEEREESKEMKRKDAVLVKRQEGEWVSLERWVQLVMGFISLGLPCFTVQTVSVKARLQLNGECCSFSCFSGRPKCSDFQHLLSVVKKKEKRVETEDNCMHSHQRLQVQLMFHL